MRVYRHVFSAVFAASSFLAVPYVAGAATDKAEPATIAANKAMLGKLNFADRQDFEDATRGLIATLETPIIRDAEDKAIWDQTKYDFLKGEAPDTANPSLWRQGQLNTINGLFEVTEGIYQIRGFDLSNMTLVRGDTGWIIIDPLLTEETARAGLKLANEHLGELPVVALIYTHSHVDHFGGALGVVDPETAGNVKVIAPEGFKEHAVAENVMAGSVMTRRASYMFGNGLEKGPKGQIGTGLGQTTSAGTVTYLPPTEFVVETGTELVVDGVPIVFQMANGSEAPSEFMFYFPKHKALCLSEVTSHVMHNLYTLRGAKVRNALDWSKYINESIQLFGGDVEVAFASHHWPTWGNEGVEDFLKGQRDVYRFIHDETLRMANQGYTAREIANLIKLPDGLAQRFATRGYYGSLKHNAEAVYNFYLGWFDGNPAKLDRLAPAQSSARYVEFMGGADAVLDKAKLAFDKGEFRWVAEVVNHVVFAEPENKAARELQAAALTQLGYVAESGPWRNFYLTAAKELREGIKPIHGPKAGPHVVSAMSLEMFFDYLGVRLNPEKAKGLEARINFNFSDIEERYALELKNGVLNHTAGVTLDDANVSFTMTRGALNALALKQKTFFELVRTDEMAYEGNPLAFGAIMSMMDEYDPLFPIVSP
ncbi:Metallo-beta-lactamase superfamily protein [Pseudovibrio axinellae]|uniref:Linear primary-alkylsulfatase n=1 Tax=Pseudovibrio axinellae TaxID=989403 RepID=A0A165WS97_9HYPH|nr:alkyl sulfatase dimerization domain-containing protein [Pseudovibrio axinellae]KZL16835.1 Metallo-beta-lactamase superfamily protein [Pseudovibrio axinellae]SER67448.1 Alkyl sulfatase BDS1, metallo-beta-lactamase superfamily [Pseudovibrio axinellae]